MDILLTLGILILIITMLVFVDNYGRKLSKPYRKERRAYPRYKTALRIYYKTQLEQGISWIKDISESGARLFLNRGLKTLKVGESLGMEINLPGEGQSFFIEGNVVWFNEDDAGLSFRKIIKGDIKELIQYVSNEQTNTTS